MIVMTSPYKKKTKKKADNKSWQRRNIKHQARSEYGVVLEISFLKLQW